MKTLPDLQQIEILILIVKHGSFRQAARALNLSPPALTSAINHLEEKLGVRLLNRSTRSLSLTAVGEEFLNNMTPVVNDYRRVVDSLNYHRLTPEGVVKVNLPRIVLDLFFQRYFIAFKTAYPDVTLELFTTDRKVNIIESGFDAGIRYSQDVPKEMIAIPFGEKTVADPGSQPGLSPPGRSARHPAVADQIFAASTDVFPAAKKYRWEFISPDGEPGEVAVKRRSGRRFRYGDDPGGGERTGDRLCLSVAGLRATERRQPDPLIAQLPLPGGSFLRLLSESQNIFPRPCALLSPG